MDSDEVLDSSYKRIMKLGRRVRSIKGYFPIYSESDYGSPVDFCFHYEGRIVETKNNDGFVIVKGETPDKRYAFDIGEGIIFGKIEVGEPNIFERNESVKRIGKNRTNEQKKRLFDFWNKFKDEETWKDVKENHVNYALENGTAIFYNYRFDGRTPLIIRRKADYMPMMISVLEETDKLLPKNLMYEVYAKSISPTLFERIYDHDRLFKKDNAFYKENAVDYIIDIATKKLL